MIFTKKLTAFLIAASCMCTSEVFAGGPDDEYSTRGAPLHITKKQRAKAKEDAKRAAKRTKALEEKKNNARKLGEALAKAVKKAQAKEEKKAGKLLEELNEPLNNERAQREKEGKVLHRTKAVGEFDYMKYAYPVLKKKNDKVAALLERKKMERALQAMGLKR